MAISRKLDKDSPSPNPLPAEGGKKEIEVFDAVKRRQKPQNSGFPSPILGRSQGWGLSDIFLK
jgi:hypothetical protein